MNVNVGSFSNPEGLEGLAHFLGSVLHLHTFFWWIHVAIYTSQKHRCGFWASTSNFKLKSYHIRLGTFMIEVTGKEAHWLSIEVLSPVPALTNKLVLQSTCFSTRTGNTRRKARTSNSWPRYFFPASQFKVVKSISDLDETWSYLG